jgi:hypothetical protein
MKPSRVRGSVGHSKSWRRSLLAPVGAALFLLFAGAGGASADASPPELAYLRDGDVWFANADGSGAQRLTFTEAESRPAWSPDGSQIASVSYRDDSSRARSALYVMDGDGGGARRITDGSVAYFQDAPVWSPDGTQIAIVGIRAGSGGSDVLLAAADGSGSRWLTHTPLQESAVQWSGIGRIVFGAFDGIYEVATPDGRPRRLVPGAWAPALSPDGSRLAYVAWRGSFRTLHVGDSTGRNPRVFVPEREHATGPLAWSPDGTRIAFTGQFSLGYSRYGEGFADHLWLVEPASGSLRRITGEPGDPRVPGLTAYAGQATWWPGGDRLFLQPSAGGVFVIGATGLCGQRLPEYDRAGPQRPVSISWHPGARPTPPALRCADVRVLGGFARTDVGSRDQLTLELKVRNAGNEPATNVRVELQSLANARPVSAASLLGQCDAAAPTPSCELGDLAAGEQTRVVFTLTSVRPRPVAATVTTTTASAEALQRTVAVHTGATVHPCRIVGTWGNDTVRGTAQADSICTLPGADRIDGLAGSDLIRSGNGDDTVTGGRGRDTIDAAGGRDVIIVRDGERDVVQCGSERDTVLADRKDVVARDCERVSRR